ncbi:bifunctional 4-hydroxy-3-methylbut-2-enyl diphosphate reductase/30S ribosomal protein S1 [Acetonema longum]|uniref:4-hydroxy-3-methylbut-2-enyl diphosphate reductase n=1 Tax=Acetonema longum DSM 6540 TaxID=1009370 RepID=F7NGC3_9FIRM|nr:bifunctional 4-hydroxy-3-methylbut-2-enyl diphosphate reductase/30S ribosomal protein S1 [Acetonema longum]EGO64916.1 4-hydroxy-3-methylbut-2-enyl diphosphate reductase/S1 RNA-binding domain protein [Acetonema longum DSM 6540]
MKIQLAEHMGFCFGVKRAIDLAQENANDHTGKIYTLGPLIHNPQVVSRLSRQGIAVAENIDAINQGTVIIRSHGVGPEVYRRAEAKGLTIVDATCPHVKKAQQAAARLAASGYQVIILGDADHPEVKSIIAWAGSDPIVIGSEEQAAELPVFPKLGVVAQTTFSIELFDCILAVLQTKCQEIQIDRTICTATDMRQQTARKLAGQVDVMVVVGGKNSANTTHLADLCRQTGVKTYHIETASELKQHWFEGARQVGITAGASTPQWIIEEVYTTMQQMEQDDRLKRLEPGMLIQGTVVDVRQDEVFVDVGYKAEGIIALSELAFPAPAKASDAVEKGQVIDVVVLDANSAEGSVKLSKVQADKQVAWTKLEEALRENRTLEAKVLGAIKGGLSVAVLGIRGFMPASQVDLKYTENLSEYAGQTIQCLAIEVVPEKSKVVLSRRALLEAEKERLGKELFAKWKVGDQVHGTVTRLADFGAFVDLGGIEGLIHISDLSWQRVKSPSEVVNAGDAVQVIIVKLDSENKRIGLSLKQTMPDPWFTAAEEYREGMTVSGVITRTSKFGAFAELKAGVEGLIHISELTDHRINDAKEAVTAGQKVTVKILGVDKKNKKISLSLNQAKQDEERADYSRFIKEETGLGVTIGDKLGYLFKHND